MFIRCEHTSNNIYMYRTFMNTALLTNPPPFCFPLCLFLTPRMSKPPLFYLLGVLSLSDRGANIHPLSSLVSDQLFTPCFLTLRGDTPRFMLHVYIDDITTAATLSDTWTLCLWRQKVRLVALLQSGSGVIWNRMFCLSGPSPLYLF
jgi:hypothetical protein